MEKEIVIIGGGFAGINLAKQLKNKKDINVLLNNLKTDYRMSTPNPKNN